MNKDAYNENYLTLQKLIGMNPESSEKILGSSILLSISGEHPRLSEFLNIILGKTFENVHETPSQKSSYSCEILSNPKLKKTNGPYIYLGQNSDGNLLVSKHQPNKNLSENNHPFLYFLIACYSGALVLSEVSKPLSFKVDEEIIIEKLKILSSNVLTDKTINIDTAYMAGAGAVGNSFLYALSTFQIEGKITIVDPDSVSGGNLNRCLFFSEDDIGKKKVEVLVEKAKNLFPKLKFYTEPYELAKIPNRPEGAWLNKLIVGVDSRRARRNLQREIPKEVFDASTTGIEEIVVHYNKRPLEDKACLGCIYMKEEQENAHEVHIAEALGVSVIHVRKQFIDRVAGLAIIKKYPAINIKSIEGIPYDTLFKQLCGEGKLMTEKNKQVLAPFAFVSALAGAFLALMFIENHVNNKDSYNYWRISPWNNINYRLKQLLPTSKICEFCNDKIYNKVADKIWKT